jgi:hypothetical protein
MTMDRPTNEEEAAELDRNKLIEHLKAAKPYLEQTLKLPNLKAEDKKIAEDDLKDINSILGGG